VRTFQPKGRYKGFDENHRSDAELLRRFLNLKCKIVGVGEDRNRLEQSVKSLGLSQQVISTGKLTRENISLLPRGRVRHAELGEGLESGFSLACGIPVVGSKVDGSYEVLLDGQLGRLVRSERA
jgi:glycosyltransferase involved in cell wall biosynthesis